MNHEALPKEESKQLFEKIQKDLFAPLSNHKGLVLWLAILGLILIGAGVAYFIQLRDGLGATAMGDIISWGLYISTFVFFVAISLVGMLISATLGLLKIEGITPVTRIAELIAVAFVMMAGLIIVFDMGRPERLLNVFIHGRVQSPIVWDITVIMTYVTISLLLLLLPLIPDMAIMQNKIKNAPKWKMKKYQIKNIFFSRRKNYQARKKDFRQTVPLQSFNNQIRFIREKRSKNQRCQICQIRSKHARLLCLQGLLRE